MESEFASIEEVKAIVKEELAKCDAEQLAVFREFAVEPHFAPIIRYGRPEKVVVVAQKGRDVIYWEEVEEGFNVSPLGPDGFVQHWCNQDELKWALNEWIPARGGLPKFKPHD